MNPIFILLPIFSLVSCVKHDTKSSPLLHENPPLINKKSLPKVVSSNTFSESYILGSWKIQSVESDEEELTFPAKGKATFSQTGKFKVNSLYRVHTKTLNIDFLTFSAIEEGTWRVENDKLILNHEVFELANLKTAEHAPKMQLKMIFSSMKKMARQSLGKDSLYEVKSQKKNIFSLFSEEDDTLSQYTRM